MSLAPYMEWAKLHVRQRMSLSGSNLLHCELADLPGAREALELHGDNDNGYEPLVEAIASTYGVTPDMVAVAQGTSGANFLVFAAMVKAGDDVLVERPGYDPLMGPPALLGANVVRFDRRFEDGLSAGTRTRSAPPSRRAHASSSSPTPTTRRASWPPTLTWTRSAALRRGTALGCWWTRSISTPRPSPRPGRPRRARRSSSRRTA